MDVHRRISHVHYLWRSYQLLSPPGVQPQAYSQTCWQISAGYSHSDTFMLTRSCGFAPKTKNSLTVSFASISAPCSTKYSTSGKSAFQATDDNGVELLWCMCMGCFESVYVDLLQENLTQFFSFTSLPCSSIKTCTAAKSRRPAASITYAYISATTETTTSMYYWGGIFREIRRRLLHAWNNDKWRK